MELERGEENGVGAEEREEKEQSAGRRPATARRRSWASRRSVARRGRIETVTGGVAERDD